MKHAAITRAIAFAYDARGNRIQTTIGGNTYGNVIDMASIRLISSGAGAVEGEPL